MPLKAYWAYAFSCGLGLEAMAAALNAAGPWKWQERDSTWYGDYLSTRPLDGVRVRIHENAGSYTMTLEIEPESRATREEVDAVAQRLLTGIGATGIGPAEPYD